MSKWNSINLILISLLLCLMLLLMILFPEQVLTAAVRGLTIWWEVLFPSLLPFFIISEMLLGFGIVHFIGTLLDPIMRPLFRVPGVGGFVMAMGYASGYPVGAKLTTRLRMEGLVTREEGERLVAFTTTSDPIFLIGAVSVGFFGRADLALTLIVAHYGAGLLVGVLMRFHAPRSPATPLTTPSVESSFEPSSTNPSAPGIHTASKQQEIAFIRAFRAMHAARLLDGRAIGTLLREAVESSLKLMIVVGGLVVFFSVIMEMLSASSVLQLWNTILSSILQLLGLPETLSTVFSSGLFEVTLGAKSAAGDTVAGTHLQIVAAAWVLSWAGLSVHAQVASILNQTDLRYVPFLCARFIHSLLAAVGAYFLFPLLNGSVSELPTWLTLSAYQNQSGWTAAWDNIYSGGFVFIGILIIFTIAASLIRFIRHIR